MSIKVSNQHTRLEDGAFQKRLDKLEVGVDDKGAIKDAGKVLGGDVAVSQVAGADAILDPAEAAKLSRATNWVGQLLGRDRTVSERATASVRELTMEVNGLVSELRRGDVLGKSADKLVRRAKHFETKLRRASDSSAIGKADPAAIKALANSVRSLSSAASGYMSQMLDKKYFVDNAEVTSNGGIMGGLAKGMWMLALAEGSVQLEKNMKLFRPLSILASDLAAPACQGHPVDRMVAEIASSEVSDAGQAAISDVMKDVEAGKKGLTRHELSDALDRLMSKHYSGLDASRVALRHADLLSGTKNADIRAALSGEKVPGLDVGVVLAEALGTAAKQAKGSEETLMDLLNVKYVRT